jgi:hypothetical protein
MIEGRSGKGEEEKDKDISGLNSEVRDMRSNIQVKSLCIISLEDDITMAPPGNNAPNNDTLTTLTTQPTGNPQTRQNPYLQGQSTHARTDGYRFPRVRVRVVAG